MQNASIAECPTCESCRVTRLRASAGDGAAYWFQCESCDRVFSKTMGQDAPIALENILDEFRFSDSVFDDRFNVAALVQRGRMLGRTM